jgi:hypothetical protein
VTTLARTLAPRKVKGLRAGIEGLRLNGEEATAKIGGAIIGSSLERTIDGASTLTLDLHDPRREILKSALLETRARLKVDGLFFKLAAVRRAGDITTLEFEDEEVSRLRVAPGARKFFRDQVTRAEAAKAMVREVSGPKIEFRSPELHVEQPIEDAQSEPRPASALRRGVSSDFSLPPDLEQYDRTYEAHVSPDYSGEQMPFDAIAKLAEWAGEGEVPGVSAAQITIGEANRRPGAVGNDAAAGYGDTFGYGLWQITTGQGWDSLAEKFGGYEGFLNPVNAALGMAHIWRVQGPDAWFGTSAVTSWDTHYTGPVEGSPAAFRADGPTSRTVDRRYAFERGETETIWAALQRLAEEVNWRCFCSDGIVYFVDELDLLDSRVEMRIDADTHGIDAVDFDFDTGKPANEVTLSGRAKTWQASPGCAAYIGGHGPANGRYIVSTIQTTLHSTEATVTLKRPTPPLPEPAPETKTITQGGSITDSLNGSAPSIQIPSASNTADSSDQISLGSLAPGAPNWGGTWPIMEQFVIPFLGQYDIPPGASKEDSGHDPDGDHPTWATTSYAIDFPTYSGETAARALAHAMGGTTWAPDIYHSFNITLSGQTFRVQVLWGGAIAHSDHIHVGIRNISAAAA